MKKRIVATMLALAMVVTNLYIMKPQAAMAANKNDTAETIFAGYYQDENFEMPSDVETAYPKYVDSSVLSVKVQTRQGTTEGVPNGTTDMRVVATVDTLNYKNVGFDLWFAEDISEINTADVEPINFETSTVLERIEAKDTDSVTYQYGPKLFDTESEYFITGTIKGIVESKVSYEFYIRPYWTTFDGTKVYGEAKCVAVDDQKNSNINMTVECNDPGDAKTLSVSVAEGEVVEAELLKWEDGYACVNIPVENKTALKSVTSVEVADESLKVEGTTSSYRNANTVYDGTNASKDTSWYNDNDAEFVILTSADLYGFQSLSADNTFEGKTIYMASDIIVNSGSPLADNWSNATVGQSLKAWSPIGPTSTYAFGGTFDGDNHTISGLYLSTNEAKGIGGLFGFTGDSVIKNVILTNSYFSATGATGDTRIGSIAGYTAGTFEDIKVKDTYLISDHSTAKSGIGGIVGVMTTAGERTISNCWFDGEIKAYVNMGGILGNSYRIKSGQNGATTMEHCLNTGKLELTQETNSNGVGGLCGQVSESTLTMKDCLNYGILETNNHSMASQGSVVGYIANTVDITNTYCISDGWSGFAYIAKNRILTVDGTPYTYTGATAIDSMPSYMLEQNALVGEEGYVNTNLDFTIEDDYAGHWTATQSGSPILSSFLDTEEVLDVKAVTTPRTAWYVESNYENTDTYTLYTKADMYGFASLQADFEGKTIKLGADIKMNEGTATAERFEAEQGTTPIMWTPKNMAGTFDGDNHTIQGIYLDTDKGNAGLFASVTGTVKNLRLQNSYFHCEDSAPANYASTEYFHGLGSIAGSLSGTLDTVYSDAIVSQDYAYAGGLVGTVYGESRITNSCFAGQVTAHQAAGGVVGLVIAKATFEHCLNTGTVTAKDQVAGGLCAYVWTDGELHLNDSLNAGRGASKDTVNYFGGAVGWVRENEHTHTIDDTYYIKFYIDADNSWANLVEKGKNTQMKIDGADVTGKQQNYNGWNEYAIIAKSKDENTKLNLSFYADGEDSSSDGDNKTCWWVDREGKIPMLESFEDLLVNVQY